ncbi:hypothetical protein DKT68_10080 [Micromonospora acroterricola]|uniref:Uncharacterized protein n=1 Tax=Micromonospora acroterricola TaxID=2202421 RepID=A0A317D724_9ACTN|nr:hypothetical protein [Micromonospora acroterricola]PWR10102.1 hypothetical protein DKT68_10080 [Micromonospora acroterricola]
MSTDPTAPLPESEPETQAHPPIDPWAAAPVTPPTTPFPATPFPGSPVPSAGQFAQFSGPPAQVSPPPTAPFTGSPAQFSGPPASFSGPSGPFAGPPVPFSAPPAQFSAPPAPFSGPPAQAAGAWPAVGPYPPMPAHPVPAGLATAGPEVVAVQIAEITVSPPVIRTPAGVLPLAGASWHVTDHWQREEKVATWALVCAILGFFCLTFFSLFFLLIKETRHYGTVQVTVTSGAQQYVARIPVSDQGQVQHINNQVNYARSLSGR